MPAQKPQNRVVMMPVSTIGSINMSYPPSPTPPESISEIECAVRLNLCLRSMLNQRKAGKLPPHFLSRAPRGYKPQVRYLLSDVENFELTKPQKTKAQK
jgi:hypothetical protein